MTPAASTQLSDSSLLKAVLDASPTLMFVVDADVCILECNAAALQLFSRGEPPFQRRGGDALSCLQAVKNEEGCGHAAACRDCVIRNAVNGAMQGESTCRRRTVLELVQEQGATELYALVTAVPFDHAGRRLVLLTIEDISVLTELWRIVPICACCKKVRADNQAWLSIEEYFRTHWDLRFTHGYCPECQCKQLAGRETSPPV